MKKLIILLLLSSLKIQSQSTIHYATFEWPELISDHIIKVNMTYERRDKAIYIGDNFYWSISDSTIQVSDTVTITKSNVIDKHADNCILEFYKYPYYPYDIIILYTDCIVLKYLLDK